MFEKRTHLAGTAAMLFAVFAFAGTAAAGNGNPNPGKSSSAPGQEKKAQPLQAATPATPAKPAKPAAKPAKPAKAATSPAPQASAGKVTICHATNSETNPYVEITISRNALKAHMKHGDLTTTPCPDGTKATKSKAKEPKTHRTVTICHATSSETNPYVVISIAEAGWLDGHSEHGDDIFLGYGTMDVSPSACLRTSVINGMLGGSMTALAPAASDPAGLAPNASQGGVAGAQATLTQPESADRGGVLGAFTKIGRLAGTLPFTGLSLLAAVLIGLVLLVLGYALHRRGRIRTTV